MATSIMVRKLSSWLLADVDVAGIDAVLGEGACAVGILLEKEMAVVVEVADDGDADAEFVERVDDFGTAWAAASVLTVTRTSSEPAWASAMTWLTVEAVSAVSVLVMDWTTMDGRRPPRRRRF